MQMCNSAVCSLLSWFYLPSHAIQTTTFQLALSLLAFLEGNGNDLTIGGGFEPNRSVLKTHSPRVVAATAGPPGDR